LQVIANRHVRLVPQADMEEAANPGGLCDRSKTKASALQTQERRRTYRSFRNEIHSTVSFRTPGHCANSLPSGI